MAGPAKQIMGELIRPRFNVYTLMDHALGGYERGSDGMYYLNGGFANIMAFSGRGNTFKSTLLDFCIFIIMLRYKAAWGSKYDTEMSQQYERLDVGYRSAARVCEHENGETGDLYSLFSSGRFNMSGMDVLPGESWYADYMRDEVENRFKEYMKGINVRETPFLDPVRRTNRKLIDPWVFGLDSASEFHTGKIEKEHAKSKVGDSEQNILNAHDALQKANMMGRWPQVCARGGFYLGFVVHLADDMSTGMKKGANDKLLDDFSGELKFAGVPRRAVSFLTNSLLVATSSKELKQRDTYNSKTGVSEPMFPTEATKDMEASGNDLKIIVYTQFRAKGGPTGVKFALIYSQELGFQYHLSLWYYLKEILGDEFGYKARGHFYELDLLPGVKFSRTTIRDQLDSDPRLCRALEITAAIAYMQNNWLRLDPKYRISCENLYELIKNKGWDWDEIIDKTVEYWMFKDQVVEGSKNTLTAMSLLAMAVDDDCVPDFLTKK